MIKPAIQIIPAAAVAVLAVLAVAFKIIFAGVSIKCPTPLSK
jgi:hypothetical protein